MKNPFSKMYNKVKLAIYKSMFSKSEKKGEALTASDYFCLQCVNLLEGPTISQFAEFLNVSAPNATYKIKKLIKKGYITKQRSQEDKREYVILPTEKFYNYLNSKDEEITLNEIKHGLSEKESEKVDKIIKILNEQ